MERGAVLKPRNWKARLQCDLGPVHSLFGAGASFCKMRHQGTMSPEGFTGSLGAVFSTWASSCRAPYTE